MKKICYSLLLMLAVYYSEAQYVSIPDAGFVTWLNNNGYSSCMSGNNLDTACAAVVNTTQLVISNPSPAISDLTGVQYFHNMGVLAVYNDFSLVTIPPFSSTLTTLILSECTSLVNVPVLPSGLQHLDLSYSQGISPIPARPASLVFANLSGTSFGPFSFPPSIDTFICQHCVNADTIPNAPSTLTYLDISFSDVTGTGTFPYSMADLILTGNYMTVINYLPHQVTDQLVMDELLYLTAVNVDTVVIGNSLSMNTSYLAESYNGSLPPFIQNAYNLNPSNPISITAENANISNFGQFNAIISNLDLSNNLITYLPPEFYVDPFLANGCGSCEPWSSANINLSNNLIQGLINTFFTGSSSLMPVSNFNISNNPIGSPVTYVPAPLISLNMDNCQITDFELDYDLVSPGVFIAQDLILTNNPQLTCLPTLAQVDSLYISGTGVTCLPDLPYGWSDLGLPVCQPGNSNGCYASSGINAGQNATICLGASYTLQGYGGADSSSLTLLWTPTSSLSNPNIFRPVATPEVTTWYVLTAIDTGGTEYVDSVLITVNNCSSPAGPNQTVCPNPDDIMTPFDMHATGTGTWRALPSNPTTMEIFSPTSPTTVIQGVVEAGIYGFVWGSAQGDTVYVTVLPSPPKPVLALLNTCSEPDTLVVHGAAGYDSIVWLNWLAGDTVATTLANDSLLTVPFAPYLTYYIAAVTDANGCVSYNSDTVAVLNCLSNPGPNQNICINSTVTMAATGPGFWQTLEFPYGAYPVIANYLSATTTITGFTIAGTYSFEWDGAANGRVYITVYPDSSSAYVSITGSESLICSGAVDTFTAHPANGGNSPSYQWYINGIAAGTDSSVFITSSLISPDTAQDKITVLMTSSLNLACVSTNSYLYDSLGLITILPVPPAPELSLAGGACLGSDSLELTGVGSGPTQFNLFWNDSLIDTASIRVSIVGGGNGVGSAANQLAGPQGMYVAANGDIYVADISNFRVQKFPAGSTSATDAITVAGGNGNGSAANQFSYPQGVWIDANGYLYVADALNWRIQQFPPGSTSATNGVTVAGGNGFGDSANQVGEPFGVFVDTAGNIYVAEGVVDRIQKFPPGSDSTTKGVVVAGITGSQGNAANQLSYPDDVFVDASGNIYVLDYSNFRVQKFPPGSTEGTDAVTVAGGNGQGSAANQLSWALNIFVDGTGNLYVADGSNYRVQKFPAGSTGATNGITVAGGNGVGGAINQIQPGGVFVDTRGALYVTDVNFAGERIEKWTASSLDSSYYVPAIAGSYTGTVVGIDGCLSPVSNAVTVSDCGGNGEPAQTICQYSTATISDSGASNWSALSTNPAITIIANPNSSTTTVSGFTVAGTYGFAWGSAPGDTVYVTVNATPPAPVLYQPIVGCVGSESLVLLNDTMPGDSVVWFLNGSAVAETSAADSFYIPATAGIYTAVLVYDGCPSPNSNPFAVNNCITICAGSSVTLSPLLPDYPFNSFLWNPPDSFGASTMVVSPIGTTQYTLVARDSLGFVFESAVLVIVDTVCTGFVWPGDANDDGVVNNYDLFPIGLAYGFNGPAREQQDINWYAHYATPWTDTVAGGINEVYSDCNGDGTVNISDVNAILQNYNLTHLRGAGEATNRSGAPPLYMVIEPDTLYNGDTLTGHIILGDSGIPATDVYALAFNLKFNPLVADSGTVQLTYPNSWLATQGQSISLSKVDFTGGEIGAGLSRISHSAATGFGEIATLSMVITTDNIDGKNLSYFIAAFQLNGLVVINELGDTVPVNTLGDSATIAFYPTAIQDNGIDALSIRLFPNPTNNTAQIWVNGGKIKGLVLTDVLGRQVAVYDEVNASHLTLLTDNLVSGVYFVQIHIGNQVVVRQLVVQH